MGYIVGMVLKLNVDICKYLSLNIYIYDFSNPQP